MTSLADRGAYDIKREATAQDRFIRIRAKIEKLADYMAAVGKQPEAIAVYASDYRFLKGAVNARLRRDAKAAERAANIDKPRKAQIKVAPEKVDELTYSGITLTPHAYTRHRAVKS